MKDQKLTAIQRIRQTSFRTETTEGLEELARTIWDDAAAKVGQVQDATISLLLTELQGRETRRLFWISTGFSVLALVLALLAFVIPYRDSQADKLWHQELITIAQAQDTLLASIARDAKFQSLGHQREVLRSLALEPSCCADHEIWSYDGRLFAEFQDSAAQARPNHFNVGSDGSHLLLLLNAIARDKQGGKH